MYDPSDISIDTIRELAFEQTKRMTLQSQRKMLEV
jgi:hypothetical protein